jgi:hypothetical protein
MCRDSRNSQNAQRYMSWIFSIGLSNFPKIEKEMLKVGYTLIIAAV